MKLRDEIGNLAAAFGSMAVELEHEKPMWQSAWRNEPPN
jgi:hypothetical protein